MELEFDRTHLTGYEPVLDTILFQEETLETIVPDAGPDILRLVDTRGTVLLKSKAAMDGRVMLTGTARLAVLYVPEGGGGPCSLEVSIPFSLSAEGKNIQNECMVVAAAHVAGADTRTMNPRKIMTRVEIAVRVRVFSEQTALLTQGIRAVDGAVEQRTRVHPVYLVSAVQEKPVSFEDSLSIPTGRPAAEAILSSRAGLRCGDTKVIGSKLIFKGEASVQVLYRPVGGGMDVADFTLPISQITEVTGVGENAVCSVELSLSAMELALREDGRTIDASLSMLAQAVLRETRSVTLLEDTYSTDCALQAEYIPFEYALCRGEGVERNILRETIETGLSIRSVVDSCCCVGRVSQSRESDGHCLRAQVTVTALCVTEEGECCAVSRSFEAGCRMELPEGCACFFACQWEELTAVPTADGIEVRLTLSFPYLCLEQVSAPVVREVSVLPQEDGEERRKPSIVLRVLQEGECLWDIAKGHGTTIGDIIKANELESEQPQAGTLLLIPRKR